MINRLNWIPDLSRPDEIPGQVEAEQAANELAGEAALLNALLDVSTEDRLRGSIVEALHWLDTGAPGRAYAVLLEALRIRTLNK